MPQDQNAQPGPQGETNPPVPEKPAVDGGMDISKILLPKKPSTPGTSSDSATRINAGVLLEQEQSASLPVPPKPTGLITPLVPQKEKTVVQALETYQGDIENLVQKKNVSVVSIAASEATRRESAPKAERTPRAWVTTTAKAVMIGGGLLLVIAALGAIRFVTRPAPSVNIEADAPAPFIFVDETYGFSVPLISFKRSTAMKALEEQRQKIELSLGLIARIYLAIPAATEGDRSTPLSIAQLFKVLGPNAPDSLVRALDPKEYLLGVHSFDGNQAFLILKTTAYEQTFSGMLQWEPYMKQDLSPLFSRTPQTQLGQESTPAFAQTKFFDRIVENHDARVIENDVGDILLLWSFIDRTTLLITTNEATLREVTSRLKNSPIVPLP